MCGQVKVSHQVCGHLELHIFLCGDDCAQLQEEIEILKTRGECKDCKLKFGMRVASAKAAAEASESVKIIPSYSHKDISLDFVREKLANLAEHLKSQRQIERATQKTTQRIA